MVGEVGHDTGVLPHAEVRNELGRADDGLGLEHQRRRGDPGDGPQRAGERVDLGLVLGVGAEPLPQEGDRVEPQTVDAAIGQEQGDVGELAEHLGVRPVEVPLPRVERGPDPAADLVVPGEAAGREVREHLGKGAFEAVRLGAVGEDVEVVAVARVARASRGRPGMLTGHVVEDEVDGEGDAGVVQHGGEVLEVGHRAEVRAHLAVVRDRVATVVGTGARREQRHEVEVGRAELAQVVDVVRDAVERAAEAVGVRHIAEGVGALEPVRGEQALAVAVLEGGRALEPSGDGAPGQVGEHLGGGVGIDRHHPGLEVRAPAAGAGEQIVDAVAPVRTVTA